MLKPLIKKMVSMIVMSSLSDVRLCVFVDIPSEWMQGWQGETCTLSYTCLLFYYMDIYVIEQDRT